jgi:alkanesulfonate monooxygenase SsuD/methylene tetrahydromethanopterin reductase-like flavin-dependent oxidoreductase (luciferase family)
MRFGVTLASASSALDEAIQTAIAAEEAGIATIYVTERHLDRAGYANAFAVAAAISAHLQQAWLGVRPVIGLQHPLRLVEQSNLLDVLMRGRSLIVLGDDLDLRQYDAFGLPTPRNGLFEKLVDRMVDAWSWQYREDGPPLEFASGPYSARMAGRIMPAPHRQPHPLLARETDAEDAVRDAARRGWPVQLRCADAERASALIGSYRETLASAGHSDSTMTECLQWLAVAAEVSATFLKGQLARFLRRLHGCGVAEVRLDPAPGVSCDDLIRAVSSA